MKSSSYHFRRGWREKKKFLIVASLFWIKCSVTEEISLDKFFPMIAKIGQHVQLVRSFA